MYIFFFVGCQRHFSANERRSASKGNRRAATHLSARTAATSERSVFMGPYGVRVQGKPEQKTTGKDSKATHRQKQCKQTTSMPTHQTGYVGKLDPQAASNGLDPNAIGTKKSKQRQRITFPTV